MFCTAKELGLCSEGSFRRKLTRPDGCVMMPLQRVDWKRENGGQGCQSKGRSQIWSRQSVGVSSVLKQRWSKAMK